MNINNAFPSKWLKAADLRGQVVTATIAGCTTEEMPEGEAKPVLRFEGREQGLVLNVTNASTIKNALGAETDDWSGHAIELLPEETDFKGKRVPCIRVRVSRRSDDSDISF